MDDEIEGVGGEGQVGHVAFDGGDGEPLAIGDQAVLRELPG